jgi:glyoxylase-like metal-dependent hydrolase (beta-lactamase superfamily II)
VAGSPWQTRQVPVLIDGKGLWVADTNCYVVAAAPGEPCVIVDAPPDIAGITQLVSKHRLVPAALLATHGHVDHAGGGAVAAGYGIGAHLHPDDEFLALDPGSQIRMLFGPVTDEQAAAFDFPSDYVPLVAGDRLQLAGLAIDVVHTPGHTPGHCCFSIADEGVLFSGDQLFAGSIGRTDLPGGDLGTLLRSMREQVMTLADEVRVLPGHGPETTIGRERLTNPFRYQWEDD